MTALFARYEKAAGQLKVRTVVLSYAPVSCTGVSCEIVPHQRLDEILWEKAAVNCFINPLAALLNCTNGQLVDPRMELAR